MKQIPLSLYVHIPWCEKKCPYCDFNSHQAKGEVDEAAYIDALIADLEHDLDKFRAEIGSRQLTSIFIGGGTPSLFAAGSLKRLLQETKARIGFANDIEITLEANPGSSELAKFDGFREAGINRLSIGVQSFNESHLQALGRVHNPQEALDAARYARVAGFDNFNLDLMFGLPEQSLQQSIDDVQTAIDLQPNHLSCYQLTIEPNTLFHHKPPIQPDDEQLWSMQEAIQGLLANHDYQQYEVSAYAQVGCRSKHNTNYWQFGDYLGIGAGAHGKLTTADKQVTRQWKVKHPTSYLAKVLDNTMVGGEHVVEPSQLPFEFMLNVMRLTDGFDIRLFEQTTGLAFNTISDTIEKHRQLKLVEFDNDHLQPTVRGRQLLDNLIQDYLPES